eukprot:1663064-Amphidinium_carterae.2
MRHRPSSPVTNAPTAAVSTPMVLKHSLTKQSSSNRVTSNNWSRRNAIGLFSSCLRCSLPAAVISHVSQRPPPDSLASEAVILDTIGARRLTCSKGKWQSATTNSAWHCCGSACERKPQCCKACHMR